MCCSCFHCCVSFVRLQFLDARIEHEGPAAGGKMPPESIVNVPIPGGQPSSNHYGTAVSGLPLADSSAPHSGASNTESAIFLVTPK